LVFLRHVRTLNPLLLIFLHLRAPQKPLLLSNLSKSLKLIPLDGAKNMVFHRLSRLGSRIVKELPRERHLSMCGKRILQRSYGQYLQSSPMLQRQTRSFKEALFSNNHKFCTSFSTTSEKGGEKNRKDKRYLC